MRSITHESIIIYSGNQISSGRSENKAHSKEEDRIRCSASSRGSLIRASQAWAMRITCESIIATGAMVRLSG
jgi:hypothetical protein